MYILIKEGKQIKQYSNKQYLKHMIKKECIILKHWETLNIDFYEGISKENNKNIKYFIKTIDK